MNGYVTLTRAYDGQWEYEARVGGVGEYGYRPTREEAAEAGRKSATGRGASEVEIRHGTGSAGIERRAKRRAILSLTELEMAARNRRLALEKDEPVDAESATILADHTRRVASELAVLETLRELES
jgi:hypothetical protein